MKSPGTRRCSRPLTLLAALAVAPPCFAQASPERVTMQDVKREAADVTEVIGEYSAERKDEALQRVEAALDELDSSIEALDASVEKRWNRMGAATRQRVSGAMKDLRRQRNRVAEWYGGLKHSSDDAWEHVKQGFTDSYSALRNAWDKAKREFDDGA